MAFVLDSSNDISPKDYEKMKSFVGQFLKRFRLSVYSRAAVVLYSTFAVTSINFEDYRRSDSFNTALKNIPHQGGDARIDLGLKKAHSDLFGPRGTARKGVKLMTIVIRGGKQQKAELSLDKTIRTLHNEGVYVHFINVGKSFNQNEQHILFDENRKSVVNLSSFGELLNIVDNLVMMTCKGMYQ